MMRDLESVETLPAVTVRESDLLEAICVSLEGDEWTQIRDGRVYGEGNERCAYGVMYSVFERVGVFAEGFGDSLVYAAVVRANDILGQPIQEANDAGVPFAEIAQALRSARAELERADVG